MSYPSPCLWRYLPIGKNASDQTEFQRRRAWIHKGPLMLPATNDSSADGGFGLTAACWSRPRAKSATLTRRPRRGFSIIIYIFLIIYIRRWPGNERRRGDRWQGDAWHSGLDIESCQRQYDQPTESWFPRGRQQHLRVKFRVGQSVRSDQAEIASRHASDRAIGLLCGLRQKFGPHLLIRLAVHSCG